jgi:hypothetical protein
VPHRQVFYDVPPENDTKYILVERGDKRARKGTLRKTSSAKREYCLIRGPPAPEAVLSVVTI